MLIVQPGLEPNPNRSMYSSMSSLALKHVDSKHVKGENTLRHTMIDRSYNSPSDIPAVVDVLSLLESPSQSSCSVQSTLSFFSQMLVQRVERLWSELGFPLADRSHIKQTLIKSVALDGSDRLSACRSLAKYLEALIYHRNMAIRASEAAYLREQCVLSLGLFLTRLGRYIADQGFADVAGALSANCISPGQMLELLCIGDRVQGATLCAVHSIQMWRQTCWRPHGFRWGGQNYLIHIQREMSRLDRCPELLPNLLRKAVSLHGRSMDEFSLVLTSSDSNHYTPHDLQNVLISDARVARKVIEEECKLQKALICELEALEAQGVFIPCLKFEDKS